MSFKVLVAVALLVNWGFFWVANGQKVSLVAITKVDSLVLWFLSSYVISVETWHIFMFNNATPIYNTNSLLSAEQKNTTDILYSAATRESNRLLAEYFVYKLTIEIK